ncbi:MAG: MlaD family protein [Thermoleophilaceae bacterium]|jgi:phospholipid/cholesterol/gamma-HCH transport system substrate-binding protein
MTPFKAGILTIVLIGVLAYFGFTKANPFVHPYKLNAVVANAQNLQPKAPVRIAGVEVGKVKDIEPEPGSSAAKVTMELKKDALPLHQDATLKVRPRIFLEGNYFVDLRPGSPSAPTLKDGSTLPMRQTAASVSLSDILGALQSDVRSNLQTLLREYSSGLSHGGAQAFNQAARYFERAYRFTAITNDALLGEEPTRDIPRALRGSQRTFSALAQDPEALQQLVTDLNVTAGALAREDTSLEASVPALRDTLRAAQPALASLNNALPTLRAFSVEALPGVRSSLPTLDVGIPWLHQARLLMRRSELRGLSRQLRIATPNLVRLNIQLRPLLRTGRQLSSCTNNVLVPFAQSKIPSIESGNSNQEVRRQIVRSFVGLSGESRLNDANTPFFHIQGVNPLNLTTGRIEPAAPQDAHTPPAHRPDVPCETQQAPNLSAPGGPASSFSSRSPRTSPANLRRLGADWRQMIHSGRFAALERRFRALAKESSK